VNVLVKLFVEIGRGLSKIGTVCGMVGK
jgi:hypothetical protein